jgi:hypothetical protein
MTRLTGAICEYAACPEHAVYSMLQTDLIIICCEMRVKVGKEKVKGEEDEGSD